MEKKYKWEIVKIEENMFNNTYPTDPNAHYTWHLKQEGSYWTVSSGILYNELLLIMKYFEVKNVKNLNGLTFLSCRDSASSALNYLLIEVASGGNYNPPSLEEIRLQSATALSEMKLPDYKNIDSETIYEAFREVWEGFNADKNWLNSFKVLINQLSNGNVSLIDASIDEFSSRVRGPAEYLKLISNGKTIRLIMGPYSDPISFD